MDTAIAIPQGQITEFCRRNHTRKLALFGSVLRHDFGPDSDVDVLVEFEPGNVPGLDFITMQNELSELLGHTVDLNTAGFLSPRFRRKIIDSAWVVYERI